MKAPRATPEQVTKITEPISSRTEFKRRFSFGELYGSLVSLPAAASGMARNKRMAAVDDDFVRRLQLAVTEVNGCAACSYEHTKMALRQGMSGEEISSFLSGGDTFVKPEEAKGIMFAQHFAESRGQPEAYAYEAIVDEYGEEGARAILAAVQVMIAGNMYGIPYSAFQSRRKGKPFKDSSVVYELGTLVAGALCLPFALVHGAVRGLVRPAGGEALVGS